MHPLKFLRWLPALLIAAIAVPVSAATMVAPGVPNFHAVDPLVYRGGQPDAQGWQSLARMGVKTVVDLCDEHSSASERRAVEAAGMTYVSVPMSGHGLKEPNAAKIAQVLNLLDHTTGPVFVHCHKGSDRTGTVIACYRIEHDHWRQTKALREARSYGMSWLNVGMKRYISRYDLQRKTATSVMAMATVGNR